LRWNSANGLIDFGEGNILPTPSPFSQSFFRLSCGAWAPTRLLTLIHRQKNTIPPQTHGHDGPQPSFNATPLSGRCGESMAHGTSWLHDLPGSAVQNAWSVTVPRLAVDTPACTGSSYFISLPLIPFSLTAYWACVLCLRKLCTFPKP